MLEFTNFCACGASLSYFGDRHYHITQGESSYIVTVEDLNDDGDAVTVASYTADTLSAAVAIIEALEHGEEVFHIDTAKGGSTMKAWILIDDCTSTKSAIFDEPIQAGNKAEAVAEARRIWDAMPDADKSLRDAFYIGHAELDEDGVMDWNTLKDIVNIK